MTKRLEKKYFQNLNATRFLAFLPVFLTHCFYTNSEVLKHSIINEFVQQHLKLGLLALDYFFVLSSFLISWIIYEEHQSTNNFNVLNFYVRRTLRIFPLYFLITIIGFGSVAIAKEILGLELHSLPPFSNFLFFVLNFYMMNHGLNFLFFLTFFWSVSVEEQFYIFWAIVLKFFRKFDVLISILLIVSSLIFRAMNLENDNRLVFHTLSSLGNFGLGCLLSKLFFYHKIKVEGIVNSMNIATKRLIYFIAFVSFMWYNNLFSYSITIIFERFIYALFFCFVIADLAFSERPTFNLEKSKFMNYFGQLSFGLYCYHGIVMTAVFYFFEKFELTSQPIFVFGITPIVLFLLTLGMAHMSYRFFEKPIIQLKSRFY